MNATFRSAVHRGLLCLLACLLGGGMLFAGFATEDTPLAVATVHRGDMSVSVSPSTVTIEKGSSVVVSCKFDPETDEQTNNCESWYCPSGCDFASGGCANADGQCTCFGTKYHTEYSSGTVSSSNPSVARATYNDGTVTIKGYMAGTATVTVYGSLRLWTPDSADVSVTVTESDDSTGDSGSGTGSGGSTASGKSGGSGGSGSGSKKVSVSKSKGPNSSGASTKGSNSVSVGTGKGATRTSSGTSTSARPANGTAVVKAKAKAAKSGKIVYAKMGAKKTRKKFKSVAGSKHTLVLWTGKSRKSADYYLSFAGKSLKKGSTDGADLTVTDVSDAYSTLSTRLGNVSTSVFEITPEGRFPAEATLSCRVNELYDEDAYVSLYSYDPDSDALMLIQSGLDMSEGYASATVSHGGLWLLADDDSLEGPVPAADEETPTAVDAEQDEGSGFPWWLLILIIVVVFIAAAVILYALYRRRHADDGEEAGADSSADESGSEADDTPDGASKEE